MAKIDFTIYKEIVNLYKKGHSYAAIAKRLGVTKGNVFNTLQKLGVVRRKFDLQKQGERHNRAKLTAKNVKDIRCLLVNGVHVKLIAIYFGVSYWTIVSIRDGKSWKIKK